VLHSLQEGNEALRVKRTLTEYASINSNRPEASTRFWCLALPIKDCCSKLAAKNYTPVISPFLLLLCFEMVKDHFLCSHPSQQTLLTLHLMFIVEFIALFEVYQLSTAVLFSLGAIWGKKDHL